MTKMGLKLRLLSWWTPNFVKSRMLAQVDAEMATATKSLPVVLPSSAAGAGVLKKKRAAMAKQHAQFVESLVAELGRDKALKQGRAAFFEAGKRLGAQARTMLGAGGESADLIRAAKVLYRALGIEFTVEWTGKETATLVVNRCALAEEYSELTCMVLSAADEGVMRGLNASAQMQFREHMTGNCQKCKADIQFKGEAQP